MQVTWSIILKCAPIIFLMMYILLKGFAFTKEYKYSQRILIGLIFSCCGDALLNLDLFPHGMGAFALAQICYITAFGWTPLKLKIGIPMYIATAILVGIIFNRLEGVLIAGLPVYAALLITMCWRSIAQATNKNTFLHTFCAIGSVLFVISDSLIGIDKFLIKVPSASILIMITYYLAQFSIALSTSYEGLSTKKTPKLSKINSRKTSNNTSIRRRAK